MGKESRRSNRDRESRAKAKAERKLEKKREEVSNEILQMAKKQAEATKEVGKKVDSGFEASAKQGETILEEATKTREDLVLLTEEERLRHKKLTKFAEDATGALANLSIGQETAARENKAELDCLKVMIPERLDLLEKHLQEYTRRLCMTEPRKPTTRELESAQGAPSRNLFGNEKGAPTPLAASAEEGLKTENRHLKAQARTTKREHDNKVNELEKKLTRKTFQLKDTQDELRRKTGEVDVMDVAPMPMLPSGLTKESIVKHSENIREGPTKAAAAKKEKQEATVAVLPRRSKRAAAKLNNSEE